ncbi:putative receptor-like protein kinase [Capsicum chinense]|nr:putative receptor-like protein kinase [Capsicum chinense]
MDSGGGLRTKGCNKCLRTWREIAKNDMMKLEDDICRFSMLILLTSQRVSDESWVDKIFHYLGDNSLPLASSVDDSGNETRRRTKFKTDLWILIGGVVGMVLVIIVTLWILSKRKAEVKPSSGRYISDESYFDESTYRRLSLKEIYSTTDNLSMSNFIGQALADKKIERCIVGVVSPANILLSSSFEAKLSDFGLSKIISIGHPYASSEVRGTFRYADPEYQKNRHVNTYGDVYSFGIVLLQLLSGQRVINLDLKKPMPLK